VSIFRLEKFDMMVGTVSEMLDTNSTFGRLLARGFVGFTRRKSSECYRGLS
jgi:hypothetical protein